VAQGTIEFDLLCTSISDRHRLPEVGGIPQPEQRQAHLRSGLHPEAARDSLA
jgi:hypothetical protein